MCIYVLHYSNIIKLCFNDTLKQLIMSVTLFKLNIWLNNLVSVKLSNHSVAILLTLF